MRLGFGGRAEARAPGRGLRHRLHDTRMGVTEDQRTPRADEVEIAVTVQVVEIRPLAAGDEGRIAADAAKRPRRAVDPARYRPASSVERLLTSRTLAAAGHRMDPCSEKDCIQLGSRACIACISTLLVKPCPSWRPTRGCAWQRASKSRAGWCRRRAPS